MKKNAYADWNQILNDLKSISTTDPSITEARPYLSNHVFVLDSKILPGKPDAIAYVSTEEGKVDPSTGKFKVTVVNPVLQTTFDEYFKNIPNIKNYQDLNKPENKELKEDFLNTVGNIVLHEGAHIPPGGKYDPTKPAGGLRDETYAKSQEKHASRGHIMKEDTIKILDKLSKNLIKSGDKKLAQGVRSLINKYAQSWEPGQGTSPFMPSSPGSPEAESLGEVSGLNLKLMEHYGYTYEFNTVTKDFEIRFTPPGKERLRGRIISADNPSGTAYRTLMQEAVKRGFADSRDIPPAPAASKPTQTPVSDSKIGYQERSDTPPSTRDISSVITQTIPQFRGEGVSHGVISESIGGFDSTPEWMHDGVQYYIKDDKGVLCLVRKESPGFAASLMPGGETEYIVWPPNKATSLTTGGVATKAEVFDILNSVPKELIESNKMIQDFARRFFTEHYPQQYREMTQRANPAMDKMSKAKAEADAIKKIAAMKEVYDQAMIFGEKNPFGRTNTKYKG